MLDFKDKKVAVLGLGEEGISSIRFLSKKGAAVAICDQKEKNALEPDFVNEAEKLGVSFNLGENYLKGLNEFDYVFRSPGVKRNLLEITAAQKAGVRITSQTILFLEKFSKQTIGVTGTKGKGTTSTLISEILKKAGKKVFLGGNIGKPPLDFIEDMSTDVWAVLELSSFQLEDCQISPHISVVLMITSEHLDYHSSTQEYIDAKKSLVSFQNEDDFAVISADYPSSLSFEKLTKGKVLYFSRSKEVNPGSFVSNGEVVLNNSQIQKICSVKDIFLPGEHNLENVTAAVAVTSIFAVKPQKVKEVLQNFKGLEHRLELVSEIKGVKYYNDSFSTTPETAMAAIKSFSTSQIIILGGSSKGSDFKRLGEEIVKTENVKAVILIGLEGPRIEQAIKEGQESLQKQGNLKIIKGPKNMGEIVQTAFMTASPGDVVLLSPACASFDLFKNYKERGKLFKEEVEKLAQKESK